jgi:hypothetical protein
MTFIIGLGCGWLLGVATCVILAILRVTYQPPGSRDLP